MDLTVYGLTAHFVYFWKPNTPTASQVIGYISPTCRGQRSQTDSSPLDEHVTSGFFLPGYICFGGDTRRESSGRDVLLDRNRMSIIFLV